MSCHFVFQFLSWFSPSPLTMLISSVASADIISLATGSPFSWRRGCSLSGQERNSSIHSLSERYTLSPPISSIASRTTLHQGGSITRIEKKFGAYFRACSCCDCDGVLLSRFGEGSSTAEHYSAISFCLRQFEPLELHLNLLLLLLKLLLLHFDHL